MRVALLVGNAEVTVVQHTPLGIYLKHRYAAVLFCTLDNKVAASEQGANNVGGDDAPAISEVLIIEVTDSQFCR